MIFSNSKYIINLSIILIFISSCSSLSNIKFWESEEVDDDEPRKLQNYNEVFKIENSWKISFDGENTLGNFKPSFSGKNIYFADTEGNVKSIDISTGIVNWSIKLDKLASGISSGFGVLIVSNIIGEVICLDQEKGSILWSRDVMGEVLSNAAIDAKTIVIKTSSGELLGLSKESGTTKWSYRSKLPTLTIRGSSSPIIEENKVYATFDSGRLGVFELDSGFLLWDSAISYVSGNSELENIIDSDSKPVIDGNFIYATNYQGSLSIFDNAQRRQVWNSPISSFYEPVVLKGIIAVIEDDSDIKTFASKTLNESWSSNEYKNRELSNAISHKGQIIIGDLDGFIHIINPLNGQTIGRKKISRKPIMTLYSRSNQFYAVDNNFNLFSLSI